MIFDKVQEIIVDTLGVEAGEVKPEATIFGDLGADSLDVVELNMALEDNFALKIPDEDIAQLKTVGDVVAYIEKKQAE